MDAQCSKCGAKPLPEKLMQIKDEHKSYYFCESCLKNANEILGMKIFLNKEERKLLKSIRKWLKYEKH